MHKLHHTWLDWLSSAFSGSKSTWLAWTWPMKWTLWTIWWLRWTTQRILLHPLTPGGPPSTALCPRTGPTSPTSCSTKSSPSFSTGESLCHLVKLIQIVLSQANWFQVPRQLWVHLRAVLWGRCSSTAPLQPHFHPCQLWGGIHVLLLEKVNWIKLCCRKKVRTILHLPKWSP